MLGQLDIYGNNKIETAIERIKMFEPTDGYYVAISGGKDSDVIADLVKKSSVKYELHHNHTTADAPETVRYLKEAYPDAEIHYPKKSMWQLIRAKVMPPTRMVRYCCGELKERGGAGRSKILGVRWAESARRKNSWKMANVCYKDQTKTINPIIDWTDDDVWEYHNKFKLPHNCLYDEGFSRVGCIGCPMAGKRDREIEFERWPKYKNLYLLAFEKMLKTRIEKGLETAWKTPEEVMAWWMSR